MWYIVVHQEQVSNVDINSTESWVDGPDTIHRGYGTRASVAIELTRIKRYAPKAVARAFWEPDNLIEAIENRGWISIASVLWSFFEAVTEIRAS